MKRGSHSLDQARIIAETRRWIAQMVIELDLCPFARRVFQGDLIRYVVSEATTADALLDDLTKELQALAAAPSTSFETTLLVHPHVLGNFLDYNDFLDVAENLVEELGLRGVIQIASFHPDYQFAEAESDAVENFTNRSPYPMLHLLREDSISQFAGDPAELLAIPERNIATLRALGRAKILERLADLRAGKPESRRD